MYEKQQLHNMFECDFVWKKTKLWQPSPQSRVKRLDEPTSYKLSLDLDTAAIENQTKPKHLTPVETNITTKIIFSLGADKQTARKFLILRSFSTRSLRIRHLRDTKMKGIKNSIKLNRFHETWIAYKMNFTIGNIIRQQNIVAWRPLIMQMKNNFHEGQKIFWKIYSKDEWIRE